ncbi:hypothetical protein JMJ77_0012458 [Colletotrichum scovillei]|uniref:Uncharacterized protein n=1 Tax=Colletotrichum scovillei TaxID=1209932 RepID=A0A9P7QSW4_9PEZI|nr:hypothetical protein JMJ78_0001521 [Colletotrichum scovillei]KAG7041942.1 hypothetical protein JMJ77_0012458 [Colletotrichum scovillei]KAG7061974.1 hypothetical protein JMJ76_0003928 [Colletotrichum scovillei]
MTLQAHLALEVLALQRRLIQRSKNARYQSSLLSYFHNELLAKHFSISEPPTLFLTASMSQHHVDVIPIYKARNGGTTLDSGNTRTITAQSRLSAQRFDEYSRIFGSTVVVGGSIKSTPGRPAFSLENGRLDVRDHPLG